MSEAASDFKTTLGDHLRELHLPTVRRCYEDKVRHAERETLSYEQYLFEVVELECQERRENRIARPEKAISRELGIQTKTIRRWLRAGQLY